MADDLDTSLRIVAAAAAGLVRSRSGRLGLSAVRRIREAALEAVAESARPERAFRLALGEIQAASRLPATPAAKRLLQRFETEGAAVVALRQLAVARR